MSKQSTDYLLRQFARTVGGLERGTPPDKDTYLDAMDGREALNKRHLGHVEAAELKELDERLRAVTKGVTDCIWGEQVALEEQWKRSKHPWYFREPIIGYQPED